MKAGDHVKILFTNENLEDGYSYYQRGRTGYINYIDKLGYRAKVSLDFTSKEVWVRILNIQKLCNKKHYSIMFRQYQKTKQEYDKEPGRLLELLVGMYERILGISGESLG